MLGRVYKGRKGSIRLGSHKFTNGTACHPINSFRIRKAVDSVKAHFEKNVSRILKALLDLFLRADFMNWRRPMVLRLPPVCVMNARKEEKR